MNESTEFDVLIDAVLPERLRNETVWHYTAPAVADLVIQNRSFWASSVVTMNDRAEMLYGMNLVTHRWESQRPESAFADRIGTWIERAARNLSDERRADSFVLCASLDEDSVAQWSRYGYCALGIATERLMTKVPKEVADGGRLAPTFTTGWRRVIYDAPGQEHHTRRLFAVLETLCESEESLRGDADTAIDRIGMECILRSIVYLKHIAFESEREVRLYGQAGPTGAWVVPHENVFGQSTHIMVRTSAQGHTGDDLPIVEIRIANVNENVPKEALALRQLLADEPVNVELVETQFRMAPVPGR